MKMMFTVAVFMAVIAAVMGGEVYMVGDSDGWTNVGHVNYKTWASTKLFQVGDTIVFRYNKIFHDVASVSYTDFRRCNGTNPYITFTTGNDTFPIKYPGHYFFICIQPGHCEAGQKVDIRVPPTGTRSPPPVTADSPAPIQPLPFPYPQPYVPSPSPAAPAFPRSPAPLGKSPASTTVAPAPKITPSQPENSARQAGVGFELGTMMMVVFVYLLVHGF